MLITLAIAILIQLAFAGLSDRISVLRTLSTLVRQLFCIRTLEGIYLSGVPP